MKMDHSDLELDIEWTDDCQGKKDFDADVLSVSTRYWPRGGGFTIINPPGVPYETNADRSILPSAVSHISLCGEVIAEKYFEGDSEAEVKWSVEMWVKTQLVTITGLIMAQYKVIPDSERWASRQEKDET